MRTYNRPMFRKGGMTNQGSGILSHVEPKPLSGYRPIPKMPLQHLGYADGGRIGYQAGGAGGSYVGNYGISPSVMQDLVKQNSGGGEDAAIRLLMDRANPSKNTSIDDLRAEQKQWINYGTRYGRPQATFQPQFTHPIHRQGSGISSLGGMPAQQAANGGRIGFSEGIGPNAQYAQNFNDINWNTQGDPYGVGSESPIYNEKPPTVAETAETIKPQFTETTTTAEQAAKNAAEAETKTAARNAGSAELNAAANEEGIGYRMGYKGAELANKIRSGIGSYIDKSKKFLMEDALPIGKKGILLAAEYPLLAATAAVGAGTAYAAKKGNEYEESLPADVKEAKNKTKRI